MVFAAALGRPPSAAMPFFEMAMNAVTSLHSTLAL